MSAAPPFTAVVATHDSAAFLGPLLDSIERHLDPAPEVIVVDTDSTDDTLAVAAGRARLVELGRNPGFGSACNEGVARAGTETTVVLNPDVTLLDAGLAELARRARGRDSLLVPRLLNADGSPQRSAHPLPGTVGALLPALVHPPVMPASLRLRTEPWRAERPRTVGWAIAACVAAPTALLRRLGPFDPEQFLFYEDMDLCLRARAAGARTELHPDLRLVHHGGHSTGPAYGGEPLEEMAARRRAVVEANRGPRSASLDDTAQALTFATRAAGRALLGRDHGRESGQLRAVLRAHGSHPSPTGS